MSFNTDQLIYDYRLMLRIRYFEEQLHKLFADGHLGGTAHLCIGQEACAVGVVSAAAADDWLVSHHRGHGHLLARGLLPLRLFAELLGRQDGYCAGRGGSQHVCAVKEHFLGTNGITGGGMPLATGAAFALQQQKSSAVAVCFFGDGATAQGTFHESLNLASLWKLPVLFVCENNGYSMSMKTTRLSPVPLFERAKAYAITGEYCDGMDVDAVRKTATPLLAEIRNGGGPALLELRTYRFCGHSRNDALVYRTRDEEAQWRQHDCLKIQQERLLAAGLDSGRLQEIETVERELTEAAATAALALPYAEISQARSGVFADE